MNCLCIFCRKFGASELRDPSARGWYDQAILESENFVAVPTIGQLVEGYLLIVPNRHVTSMGNLEQDSFEELLAFTSRAEDKLEAKYRKSVIFEHGAVRSDKPAGCCVDHAHWHIVPCNFNPLPELQEKYVGGEIYNPRQLQTMAKIGMPYLFFQNTEGHMWLFQGLSVPGQFFRRLLALEIGKKDEWDYVLFPFEQHIRSTIAHVTA